MVELGLRMQMSNNRLSTVDAAEFKRQFKRRQLIIRSHAQFQQQLTNLDAQILLLEDAQPLDKSLHALHGGVKSRHSHMEILESVRTELSALTDTSRLRAAQREIDASLEELTTHGLEQQLDTLMHDDQFMGQFDPDVLASVRVRLLSAPSVPRTEPTTRRDVELALGIAD